MKRLSMLALLLLGFVLLTSSAYSSPPPVSTCFPASELWNSVADKLGGLAQHPHLFLASDCAVKANGTVRYVDSKPQGDGDVEFYIQVWPNQRELLTGCWQAAKDLGYGPKTTNQPPPSFPTPNESGILLVAEIAPLDQTLPTLFFFNSSRPPLPLGQARQVLNPGDQVSITGLWVYDSHRSEITLQDIKDSSIKNTRAHCEIHPVKWIEIH